MHPPGEEIQTERLILRAPRGEDERDYRRLLLEPRVARWLRPPPLRPLMDPDPAMWLARDIAHWRENGFGPWTLHDSQSGEFLGRAGLSRTTSQGAAAIELTWAIMPNRWGEGLATEAGHQALAVAVELGLGELIAYTLAENVASRRVMEKLCMGPRGEITHSGLPHILFSSAGRVHV